MNHFLGEVTDSDIAFEKSGIVTNFGQVIWIDFFSTSHKFHRDERAPISLFEAGSSLVDHAVKKSWQSQPATCLHFDHIHGAF